MRLVIDIETNALVDPSIIWCALAKDIDTGEVYEYGRGNLHEFASLLRKASLVVGHNIIGFDYPNICRLVDDECIDPLRLKDTLILSHLFNFSIEGGHSLETWAERFHLRKEGLGITDWTVYNPIMLERCRTDVEINARLFLFLEERLKPEHFKEAVDAEHAMAFISLGMHRDGFAFDRDGCVSLLLRTRERLASIDEEILKAFPPKVKTTVLKTKTKIETIPFNPGSTKQLVERLNEAGWKPTEKTKSGKSWKVSETNLSTLPDSAPQAARRLVERILLRTRVSTLESWLSAYRDITGRVHGTFRPIGTWTHRMGHRNPNLGNISAEKSIKYKGEYLKGLATEYGGLMRSLWGRCDDSTWLVGCDADSIQLRIFAHYIDDPEFTEALLKGTKEDGTDPHSRNAHILGCTRDSAKTFIYAFLLGAGDAKLGEILGVGSRGGRGAKQDFIRAYPGLKRLKEDRIPEDAKRGYFRGFDGRLVVIPGEDQGEREHLALAGYLQNGEAVIMKHACIKWREDLRSISIPFIQVNMVHDEFQTEIKGTKETAEYAGTVQADAIRWAGEKFNLKCPMSGSFRVGKNWLDTH
jgi:DNA polymerase I